MNVQFGEVPVEHRGAGTPLYDLAAEQQLLGACLIWPDAVDDGRAVALGKKPDEGAHSALA
jgi:hypothetical protein